MDTSQEHELVALAAELERYWSDQWRRLAAGAAARPELRLVNPPQTTPDAGQTEQSPPALKLVDA